MTQSQKVTNSLTWVIGGAQGSGVDSAANIFSRACAQAGMYIFGKREFYSNIKGEHSYFTVRVSEEPARSHVDDIDILVSFDAETVFRHGDRVTKNGAIIYDSTLTQTTVQEVHSIDYHASERIAKMLQAHSKPVTVQGMLDYAKDNGAILYKIPYFSLLKQFSEKINDPSLSKLTRMVNVMALSASMAILDFDSEILDKAIKFVFRAKPKVADSNIAAARYAYNHIKSQFDLTKSKLKLNSRQPSQNIILVQGNQSSAMGKITAGCRFQTYYPITPASDDSEFLESNQIIRQTDNNEGSIVVVQTEDEIAAITMAIGGALTGARSATATSGPGFSLMAEALGWAGMNEVPLVVSLYQRAGPATGLPTRHEQGDLMFAINAGHGEFPRIVFASGDIEESFYDTIKAFNFAEKYQMPVIHLLDKAIANSIMTCKIFDQNKVTIDRGQLLQTIPNSTPTGEGGHYLRFKLDENPVSPRVALGTENGIFWNTGDEHSEEGHISEDPVVRVNMMNKRLGKLDLAMKEISAEDKAVLYGEDDSTDGLTLLSWGSTKGAILDALDRLLAEGKKIKFIQIRLMHPFPAVLLEQMLDNTKVLVDIEMNYTSQLGLLLKQNLNRDANYRIVKYNGRPMSSSEVYNAIKRIINGDAPRRIVLENGT
ncbi:MAG TPA: 2-oxoacid:ferredoxin oxidoreductase subunit alpha [Candidatus Nitrosopolaris sp.]